MLQQTLSDVRALNDRLSAGSMFFSTHSGTNDAESFFKSIRHLGLDPHDIIVLSLTPDGDDTVIGRLMTRERTIYFFDCDLVDPSYSILREVEPQAPFDGSTDLRGIEALEEAAGIALLNERL